MVIIHHSLTFAGGNSLDFGVQISGGGTFGAPERVYEVIEVPGRNGNLLIDQNRYANVPVSYPAFIARNFSENVESWRNWLLSHLGYHRLEDTYHPDEYRMACFNDVFEVETTPGNTGGRFTINFTAKPQRWLKIGDELGTIISGQKMVNPTAFTAKPLIRAYGIGTIQIGGQLITVSEHGSSYVDIDSELMDCYYGSINKNAYVSFSGNNYPEIPGGSEFTVNHSGFTLLQIKPRWWRL